jgi:hypothetical protein
VHNRAVPRADPHADVVDCAPSDADFKVAEWHGSDSATCDRTRYDQYSESGSGGFTLCLEPLRRMALPGPKAGHHHGAEERPAHPAAQPACACPGTS